MSGALAALAWTLLGYGILRLLRPAWPHPALIGAAMVGGPPLATAMLFAASELGLSCGAAPVRVLAGLGALLAFLAGKRAPVERARPWSAALAILAALAVAAPILATMIALPSPAGDGLAMTATKARFAHATGDPWLLLLAPESAAIHPDYPLHGSVLMQTGWLIGGDDGLLAALLPGVLVMPGAALFLVSLAARRGAAAGILAAVLLAASPLPHLLVAAGYQDPPLGALVAVAAGGLACSPAAPWAAALALGLLPWIKLEGAVHAAVVAAAFLSFGGAPRRIRFTATVLAGLLALLWPAALAVHARFLPLAESVTNPPFSERLAATARVFAAPFTDPEHPCALLAWVVVIAGALGLASRRSDPARLTGFVALALVLLPPALTLVRNSSLMTLEGGIEVRLWQHVFPTGAFTVACVAGAVFRRTRAHESSDPVAILPAAKDSDGP